MGEDTQKTQDFTEAHPGNTSLHGEYTVNGASGLDELYVKDNDRITVEFKADEDYFLKDVIYNGKSMLGSLKETTLLMEAVKEVYLLILTIHQRYRHLRFSFLRNGRIQPPCPVEILFYHGM